ncbi:MAG TPA: cysteine peptidase family C39 domain-containing protein, partial [Chitinophagaceae bacterium]|nr:cysteine peptidase family C39 domain-containing protein [Chitinophagaceae bacterium]
MRFPFYKQHDSMDCGPACLRMTASYYGKHFTIDTLRSISGINSEGVSLLGISEAAEKIGFRTAGVQISLDELLNHARRPCIVHWNQNHFVVLAPQSRLSLRKNKISVADPSQEAMINLSREEFKKHWLSNKADGKETGITLLLEPTDAFYNQHSEPRMGTGMRRIGGYVWQHKNLLF